MNQREAKRRALRMAWIILEGTEPEWNEEEDEARATPTDCGRMDKAWEELRRELFNRGHPRNEGEG